MKLTTFLATALTFSAFAEEPVNWQIAGTKPVVLQGWGTIRDIYGVARFSQKSNSLSIEFAGGDTDAGKYAPAVLQEVEGDFEASVTIQPGINPDGRYTNANRVLWNSAGLLVELDGDNYARLELSVRQPLEQKDDNQIWMQRAVRKNGKWNQIALKDANRKRPLHLRIQRTGTQLKWAHSFDKETWTELEPFEAKDWPAKLKVGVQFVNITTKVMKATVSDLKITPATR